MIVLFGARDRIVSTRSSSICEYRTYYYGVGSVGGVWWAPFGSYLGLALLIMRPTYTYLVTYLSYSNVEHVYQDWVRGR